jgi:hypothetical protein
MIGSDWVEGGSLTAVSSVSDVISSGSSVAGESSPAGPQAVTNRKINMNKDAEEKWCFIVMRSVYQEWGGLK